MKRDGIRSRLSKIATFLIVTIVLLPAVGARAQDITRSEGYALGSKAIAPKIAQSITWGIVDAVSGRVDNMDSLQASIERMEASPSVKYGLNKLSNGKSISYNSSRMEIAENGEVNGARGTLWGFGLAAGGDFHVFDSGDGADVDWSGKVATGHFGVDVRPVREMLAGVAVGVSKASSEFEIDGRKSLLEYRMITGSPYLSWVLSPALWWWATATYGAGESTITDTEEADGELQHAGDSSLLSGAVGFALNMMDRSGVTTGSRLGIKIKGQGSINEFKTNRTSGEMPNLSLNTWRGRVLLQGTYEEPLGETSYLIPTLEAGIRYDSGPEGSGAGLELGGRLRFEDLSAGLTLEAYGRALVPLDNKSKEWTAGGLVRISSDRDGYGPFLNVTPSFETTEAMVSVPVAMLASNRGQVEAELGYNGLKVDGVPGLLAPYGTVTLADGGASTYRWGSRLALANHLNLNLEAQHERAHLASDIEHSATFSANLQL